METISADELLQLQERAETLSPEKLVIVVGPTFGSAMKFLLLGAALGAVGVTLWQGRNDTSASETPAGEAVDGQPLQERASALLRRARGLAGRVRDAAQTVAEAAKPAIEDAIQQGKKAAQQTEHDLEAEISQEEG